MNPTIQHNIDKNDFLLGDQPGKKLVGEIGIDENGREVATYWTCDKDGCNCVGKWSDGHTDRVHTWLRREDFV